MLGTDDACALRLHNPWERENLRASFLARQVSRSPTSTLWVPVSPHTHLHCTMCATMSHAMGPWDLRPKHAAQCA